MNKLSVFSRALGVFAAVLVALSSVTVLTGCAGKFTPASLINSGGTPNNPSSTGQSTPPASTMGVAFNPNTNLLYVLKKGDVAANYAGTVSVINQATNAITATISVGAWPEGVAVNPLTNTIYVTDYAGPSLSIINGATNLVTATIPNTSVGDTPSGVAVNPLTNKVYVTDVVGDLVYGMYVLDGSTGALLSQIPTNGDVFSVAVNTLTNTIYATTQYSVLVINGDNDVISSTIAGPVSPQAVPTAFGASGIVVDEAANIVYAGSTRSSTSGVTVINGATNAITATVALGSAPSSLALDPIKHVVYATMANPAAVAVIDTTTNSACASLSLVASPVAVAVNPSTSLVYVTEGTEVAVINPASQTTTDIPIQ